MSKNISLTEKAKQLYIYAFAAVVTEITHWGSDDKGFSHLREFPDENNKKVVKFNNDTLYSIAWTQLANTPYIAHIPEIKDRYYLFPVLDAYTNVFESIGTRTPERSSGDYIFLYGNDPVPAGYENYKVIRSDYSLNAVLLRIETRGKKDYEYINQLQDKFEIHPLFPEKVKPVRSDKGIIPSKYSVEISAKEFFTIFAELSETNPVKDSEILSYYNELGLSAGNGFNYDDLTDEQKAALEEGRKQGLDAIINEHISSDYNYTTNNWTIVTGGLGSYGTDYLRRASSALGGWGANIPEDSAYGVAFTDSEGNVLTNKNNYVLHIEPDGYPHAAVFWSVTLYGEPSHYPVKNKISRFALNTYDVEDSIVLKNEDGSLDIYVSKDEPEDVLQRRNWLPAPSDEEHYTLTLRIYWPDEDTLNGKWIAPVIRKI